MDWIRRCVCTTLAAAAFVCLAAPAAAADPYPQQVEAARVKADMTSWYEAQVAGIPHRVGSVACWRVRPHTYTCTTSLAYGPGLRSRVASTWQVSCSRGPAYPCAFKRIASRRLAGVLTHQPACGDHSPRYCRVVDLRSDIQVLRYRIRQELARKGYKDKFRAEIKSWVPSVLERSAAWHRSVLQQVRRLPDRLMGNVAHWICIHEGEGAWDSNTGNGYYGGLQMDRSFMATYGADMIRKYGAYAHEWTPRDQIIVAERARASGRSYHPWPTTARRCGLI